MAEDTSPTRRIVVGIDGSEPSKQALRWAARLAPVEGATIEAIAAWEIPMSFDRFVLLAGYSPREDVEKALTECVDDVFGSERPADLRLTVTEGNPAQVLLRAAEGAHLVIVGSRGHGGFIGVLLGSVSSRVAELSPCPVLVVHGTPTT